MYYLDTCICIEFLRGHMNVGLEIMRKSEPGLFKIPAIVEAELRYGAEHSNNPESGKLLLNRFLAPFEVVPFDGACARAYGVVRQQLNQKRVAIGERNNLIAASAIAGCATLVTNNYKDFKHVENLQLEIWEETEI